MVPFRMASKVIIEICDVCYKPQALAYLSYETDTTNFEIGFFCLCFFMATVHGMTERLTLAN